MSEKITKIWNNAQDMAMLKKLINGKVSANLNGVVALADDTLAHDFIKNRVNTLAITDPRTITTTVPPAGCVCYLIVTSDGAHDITFGSGFKATANLTTANGKYYTMSFISDGTNLYEISRTTAITV